MPIAPVGSGIRPLTNSGHRSLMATILRRRASCYKCALHLGLPVVAPEILLLHKPRLRWRRPKDEHDFAVLCDRMSTRQRSWLAEQLARVELNDPWLQFLR